MLKLSELYEINKKDLSMGNGSGFSDDFQIHLRDENEGDITRQNSTLLDEIERKNLKKSEKAKLLVEKSMELISSVENELESIEDEILEDIEQLEEKRDEFFNTSFRESKNILDKMGLEYPINNENGSFDIELDRNLDNIEVKDISTGAFSGFVLGFLSMLGVIAGAIYYGASKLGIDLKSKLENFPNVNIDQSTIEQIFGFISKTIMGESNPDIGMGIVGASALLIGFIIYKIRVALKESKNYKEANRIYQETNEYIKSLKDVINEFKRIKEHIKEIIPTVDDYKYVLNEQSAKLKRALHVEGEKEDYKDYHSITIETMKDTKRLMKQIEELLTTPVIIEGDLSQNSVVALNDTKNVYNYFLSKIYN